MKPINLKMKPINLKKKSSQKSDDIITQYFDNNNLKKNLDKELKEMKPIILQMIEDGKGNNGSYEAVKSIRERKSVDEEKLIEIIKEYIATVRSAANDDKEKRNDLFTLRNLSIIKTREYVDDEALEKAIYDKLIDPQILAPAQSVKEEIVLTVKEIK